MNTDKGKGVHYVVACDSLTGKVRNFEIITSMTKEEVVGLIEAKAVEPCAPLSFRLIEDSFTQQIIDFAKQKRDCSKMDFKDLKNELYSALNTIEDCLREVEQLEKQK